MGRSNHAHDTLRQHLLGRIGPGVKEQPVPTTRGRLLKGVVHAARAKVTSLYRNLEVVVLLVPFLNYRKPEV